MTITVDSNAPRTKDGRSISFMLTDLHRTIASQPLMPQSEIVVAFQERQVLLYDAINVLLSYTHYVEAQLLRVAADVAANTTHGRAFYSYTSRRFNTDEREEEWLLEEKKKSRAPHARAFYKEMDLELLAFTSVMAKRIVHHRRTSLTDVRRLHLLPIILEEILYAFLTDTKLYMPSCQEAARLRSILDKADHPTDQGILLERISALDSKIEGIESIVYGDGWSLTGAVRDVHIKEEALRKIRDSIHDSYLRLTLKVAKRHAVTDAQVEDHFQNASAGLLRAISTYEVTSGVTFSTYAQYWVRQAVLYAIKSHANTIGLPVALLQEHTQIVTARRRIKAKKGDVTEEEVALAVGKPLKRVRNVLQQVMTAQPLSLDHPVSQDGGDGTPSTLGDFLGESYTENMVADAETRDQVNTLLATLDDDGAKLVRMHFGLFDSMPQPVEITERQILEERLRQQYSGIVVSARRGCCKRD